MAKNSRLFSLLLFSIISTSLLQPITIRAHRWHTASAFLLSSCLLSYNKDKAAASAFAQKIAHATNTDAQDLVDATTLSLYYWAWSFLLSKHNSFQYRYDATIQPLIQIASTTKCWNDLFARLPLLNKFACSHDACEGICDSCEYKHLIKKIPFEAVSSAIKEPLDAYYYNKEREAILERANQSVIEKNKANEAIRAANAPRREEALNRLNRLPDTIAPDNNNADDNDCSICSSERVPLIRVCNVQFNNPRDEHRTCASCYINLLNHDTPRLRRCPICRGNLRHRANEIGVAELPHIPDISSPLYQSVIGMPQRSPNITDSLVNTLGEIGVKEPLWTFLRRNNSFLYRWAMAFYQLNPLIARHISCKNSTCISICNHCKLKKLYTPMYLSDARSLKNYYQLYKARGGTIFIFSRLIPLAD